MLNVLKSLLQQLLNRDLNLMLNNWNATQRFPPIKTEINFNTKQYIINTSQSFINAKLGAYKPPECSISYCACVLKIHRFCVLLYRRTAFPKKTPVGLTSTVSRSVVLKTPMYLLSKTSLTLYPWGLERPRSERPIEKRMGTAVPEWWKTKARLPVGSIALVHTWMSPICKFKK